MVMGPRERSTCRAVFAAALAALAVLLSGSARAEPMIAGYDPDSGAFLGTADGAWLLNPYAMVQLTHATTFERGDVAASSFRLHSAKMIFHGHVVSPKISYHFQTNFGEGKAVAEDLYLRADPDPRFGVLVGQNEVPFNRQHITLEAYQELIDRSTVDQRFTLQRDIGVIAYAAADAAHRLEATAGVFNGARQNAPNDDRTFMTTLRLAYNPWGPIAFREADLDDTEHPKLSLAFAAAYNPRRIVPPDAASSPPPHDVTHEETLQGVAEVTLRWRGVSMTGETHARRERVAAALRKDAGTFFQVGVFAVPRHVQVVVRDAFIAGDLWPTDVAGEQTLGVSWYVHGHRFKLQADGSRLQLRSGPDSWRVRAQLEFFL